MPFIFRRSIRLFSGVRLNLGRRRASVSVRSGPVTVNSRGRVTVRLLRGLSWRNR
jgi:hypothetical protein